MHMCKSFGLMLVLILAFVLSACNGVSNDTSDTTNNTRADIGALSQTITSVNNVGDSLTVTYPEGWLALDALSQVYLADSEATLEMAQGASTPQLEDNNVIVIISTVTTESVALSFAEGTELTPVMILEMTIPASMDVQPVEAETINGKSAATGVAVSSSLTDPGRVFAVAVEVEGGYIIVTAITAQDETDFDDTIRAIAGEAEVTFTVLSSNAGIASG